MEYRNLGRSGLNVSELCARTISRVGPAWQHTHAVFTAANIGLRAIEQLMDNLGALEIRSGAEEIERIHEAIT